jgi:hypothetical protein
MQNWQANWEVRLRNIVRRLLRCKVQNCEMQLGNIVRRIGSCKDAMLARNWEVEGGILTGGWCRIRRSNDGILAGELGGTTVQFWQANWEVERCRIGNTAVQIRSGYWEMQGWTIGRRIGRLNGSELGGARA